MNVNGRDDFVFPLSKTVVLVNDFALRRDALEMLPVPLALVMDDEWVWLNRMGQDATMLDNSRDAEAAAEGPGSDMASPYRREIPPFTGVRSTPVRNLDGQVVGQLAWSGDALAALALEQLDTAVLVARDRVVLWANDSARERLDVHAGSAWDKVSGFPPWDDVAGGEGTERIGDDAMRYRAVGGYVIVEVASRSSQESESSLPLEQVASMVHEIRNPLAALSGYVEMAQMEAGPKATGYYDSMMREIERLSRLTSDLLSVSRVPAVTPRWTAFDPVVDSAWLAAFKGRRKDRKKFIELVKNYDSDQKVWADPDRLQQVLTNLMKNAVEAMSRKGSELEVFCQDSPEGTHIVVRDDGPGLSEDDLKKLSVVRFTTKKSGSGLGLMIVRRIMQAHGGRMRVTSPGGLVVGLTFPHPD